MRAFPSFPGDWAPVEPRWSRVPEPPSSRRSLLTLDPRSSERGFFDAVADKTSHPSFADLSFRETLPALDPEWVVDDGEAIVTITTGEIWSGLADGTISPFWRVWREGMEAWAPIIQVGELACATQDLDPIRTHEAAESARRTSAEQVFEMTPAPVEAPIDDVVPMRGFDRAGILGVAAACLVAVAILVAPATTFLGAPKLEPARAGATQPVAKRAIAAGKIEKDPPSLQPYFPAALEHAPEPESAPVLLAETPAPERKVPERGQKRRRK